MSDFWRWCFPPLRSFYPIPKQLRQARQLLQHTPSPNCFCTQLHRRPPLRKPRANSRVPRVNFWNNQSDALWEVLRRLLRPVPPSPRFHFDHFKSLQRICVGWFQNELARTSSACRLLVSGRRSRLMILNIGGKRAVGSYLPPMYSTMTI